MAKQDVELQFKLIDGVSKGLASIQQGVNGLGASIVKINAAAELTGKAFGAIGSVAGAFGDAIQGAASVEDALTRVNTITRATVEEQKDLQNAVRGAVEGTRFSAEEAAGALVLLAEDGFSAKEAVQQLGSVLQFAQANAQSAATASAGLGAILDTYGEKPQVIGELADKLTAVAVGAGTSTKALQEGLAGVGNSADQAGLSLDQTIGLLGLLASRGIEGGAAVSQLNLVIRNLADPASKAGKEIKALGLDADDFAGVIKRLGTDSVAAEKVLSALGRKPREALRVLLNEGGGDLGKFRQILDESAGSTKAASDALNDNFAGALERIQNQLAQARNDFLTPILEPLTVEIEAFRDKLDKFTESKQFDKLTQQFTTFVTTGVEAFGNLIEKVDFDVVAAKVAAFVDGAGKAFNALVIVVKATAGAIVSIAEAIDVVVKANERLAAAFGANINPVQDFVDRQKALQAQSVKVKDALDAAGSFAKKFGEVVLGSGKAAATTAASFNDLGASAVSASEDIAVISSPSEDAKDELVKLSGGAEQAAIGLERLRLSTLVSAQALLFSAGQASSASFAALTEEIGKTEEKIAALEASTKGATEATDEQTKAVQRLKLELQSLGQEQDNVEKGNKKVAKSNSQVSESFGNIGNKASSAAISLGNLTEAYVREALAAAGSAKSAKEYINTLNSYFAAAADVEKQIVNRLDVLGKQNVVLSEEDEIRARLIRQYGNSSRLIEDLVQAELRLSEAKRKTNDEAERGIAIEDRRTAQAGLLGGSQQAEREPPVVSTGSRGSSSQTGPSTVFNVQIDGLTAAGIREVTPLLERELARLGALRR